MNANEKLIHQFYTAFANKDFKTMQSYYADNAIFNDSVFTNLNSAQVKAMWQMLIIKGKGLKIHFSNIVTTENRVKAHWEAHYIFSLTRNNVFNQIDATFEIANGKIVKHTDHFNFYAWAKQAFGLTGFLIGWTPFFRKKVSAQAMKNLKDFMQKD